MIANRKLNFEFRFSIVVMPLHSYLELVPFFSHAADGHHVRMQIADFCSYDEKRPR